MYPTPVGDTSDKAQLKARLIAGFFMEKIMPEKIISNAPYCTGFICIALSYLDNYAGAIGAVCVIVATVYNIWHKQKQLKQK